MVKIEAWLKLYPGLLHKRQLFAGARLNRKKVQKISLTIGRMI
jgi:hypothetical protein